MVRQASRYADLAVQKVIAVSYYGVSDLELFSQGRAVQMQIMKETEFGVLTTNVLCGAWPAPLSAQPHGVPRLEDRLKEGPHIALSLMRVNGYAAECERTFFTAPPSSEAKEAFAAVTEARQRAFALVKPGARCSEIDMTANGFLRERGYGDRLLHRTGHGFGLGNHEGPWVADGSDGVLQENMIISVEPGIYLPGTGGIRHSDTVLVTRNGYESLTRYPVDLESLVIKNMKPFDRLRGRIVRAAVGMK
jgi:Xaa-Pro dipeptidase